MLINYFFGHIVLVILEISSIPLPAYEYMELTGITKVFTKSEMRRFHNCIWKSPKACMQTQMQKLGP